MTVSHTKASGSPVLHVREVTIESVHVNARGDVTERCSSTVRVTTEILKGGVPLELVFVPGGSFWMGASAAEGFADERPRHRAIVPDFLLGRAPVTQAQWQAAMGTLPPCRNRGAVFPVDRVSWRAAQSFCAALSKQTQRSYRLPSETEWEYACRARSTSPFNAGPTLVTDLANYVGVHTYADESPGVYRHHTTEAGLFPPNAFGLFDMHGNVWEWCADAWHASYEGAPADGRAWLQDADTATAALRVLRGGCWHDPPNLCRSAARLKSSAGEAEDYFGLRVVLSSLKQEPVPGAPRRRLAHNLRLRRGRE